MGSWRLLCEANDVRNMNRTLYEMRTREIVSASEKEAVSG
jgi:hypothetical protein